MKYIERVINLDDKDVTIILQPLGDENILCSSICPYGIDVCSNLPSPTSDHETFTGFCSNIHQYMEQDYEDDNYSDEVNKFCIPIPGTIEKLLGTDNVFKLIGKSNPYIRLEKIIDSMCNGTCEFYNKEHSGCTEKNKTCVLYDLIYGRGKTK